MSHKTLAVIGGGAAGFFCAVNAARMNTSLEVVLVEKTSKLLSKVRISGGGRCNVTHACFDIEEMSHKYPRGKNFVKKTFHSFFTPDIIEWFAIRGVALKTEADGRMFPITDSSQSIIDCLLNEAKMYKVQVLVLHEVKCVTKTAKRWQMTFANGRVLEADVICIASGGYSKQEQFTWIKELGHSIELPVPSLFTFNMPGNPLTTLMGVSVSEVKVKIAGTKLVEKGAILITHWGLSGPAILRLSAWGARVLHSFNYSFDLMVNWVPFFQEQSIQEDLQIHRFHSATKKISQHNPYSLPNRLWHFFLLQCNIDPTIRWADITASSQKMLARNLCSYVCRVEGKTTYKEEFVTAGGISLNEINVNTMKSKLHDDLYFCGEAIDVDGITGGFNFQHAWTSGWIAANSVSNAC